MEQHELSLSDYLGILRRRKAWFIVPTVIILAIAISVATLWPPTYQSSATVLVEEAEVPEDMVGTLVTDYIEKRLEAITRRVLVSNNMIDIIERFDLYPDERKVEPILTVVSLMRNAIGVETLSTAISDPATGRLGEATVAFEVSFEYGAPETTQRVANELVSLYLNENLRQRREKAIETTRFLAQERERTEERIAELRNQLAEFKTENSGALPEQLPYNQQLVTRAEQDMVTLEREIRSLRDRETYLAAQLALIEPYSEDDKFSPAAELDGARLELATLTSRYGPSHPDVIAARSNVAALQRIAGSSSGDDELANERERLASELGVLRERYSDEHPDVRRLERQLASLDTTIASATSISGLERLESSDQPTNAAYLSIQAQLAGVQSQIAAYQPQIASIDERLERYQELVARTPTIEQEYDQLQLLIEDLEAAREELIVKENSARLGQALENEAKAERFSLIEPPNVPIDPVRPRRSLIALIGVILAFGSGLGSVALRNMLDNSVTGPRDVTAIIGIEPLGVIPRISTAGERARRLVAYGGAAACVLAMVVAGAWYIHTRIIPLDTAAFVIWRDAIAATSPYVPDQIKSRMGLNSQ